MHMWMFGGSASKSAENRSLPTWKQSESTRRVGD